MGLGAMPAKIRDLPSDPHMGGEIRILAVIRVPFYQRP